MGKFILKDMGELSMNSCEFWTCHVEMINILSIQGSAVCIVRRMEIARCGL